ncbi:MAG: DUF1998 domain-containing protein [Microlunatus sp.]|nr:DUF1998 domain-containing protein [Microlunatus sp.]
MEVRQVERLGLVRALVGFTRFDAPDPDEPDLVTVAPLTRAVKPEWVPATEVRGEGIFVRLDPVALVGWEERVGQAFDVQRRHREAYAQFRADRYSGRYPMPVGGWASGWPGLRYYLASHSLSHIVLRAIALECGYSAASLGERIYTRYVQTVAGAGFLIYTAVPDAEGTLGGLVGLGEPANFSRS